MREIDRVKRANAGKGQNSLGQLPARGPTDPYVRDSRTRFLESGARCTTIDRVDRNRPWQGIAHQQASKNLPSEAAFPAAPVKPLAPDALGIVVEGGQALRVAGDPVIPVVPAQALPQDPLLRLEGVVAGTSTVSGDRSCPASPATPPGAQHRSGAAGRARFGSSPRAGADRAAKASGQGPHPQHPLRIPTLAESEHAMS